MHIQKGYSLIELLAVLVLLALLVVLVTTAVVGEIDKARGHMLISQARLVSVAAQAVMLENKASFEELSDHDYMAGLTGAVDDNKSRPEQTRLSQKMNELIAPEITLAAEATETTAKAEFVVKDGEIVSMTYEAMAYSRYYIVTIAGGETTVARVEKDS